MYKSVWLSYVAVSHHPQQTVAVSLRAVAVSLRPQQTVAVSLLRPQQSVVVVPSAGILWRHTRLLSKQTHNRKCCLIIIFICVMECSDLHLMGDFNATSTSDLLLYSNSLVIVTFSEPVVVYNQQTVAVSLPPWGTHCHTCSCVGGSVMECCAREQ